jgi:small subunit ribosomal protein S18
LVAAKKHRSKKRCRFSQDGISPRPAYVDYKDVELLKKMMSGHGKMLGRRRTGNSAVYQRAVSTAIKRARYMGLLPYVGE